MRRSPNGSPPFCRQHSLKFKEVVHGGIQALLGPARALRSQASIPALEAHFYAECT
jgi:hypothetical protein